MSQNSVSGYRPTNPSSSLTCILLQTSPQGGRVDELPIVQTKAKMTNTLKRNTTSEFGKDPMFESSRCVELSTS